MSVDSKIVKSRSDSKDYRLITLKNGLRALLISDLKGVDLAEEKGVSFSNGNHQESDSGGDSESEYDTDCSDELMEVVDDEEKPNQNHTKRMKKQAAAALCVDVGSFSDPEDIPGLAHFLEHMVFMGSEKYPNENIFDSFICKHGGSDNAHTDTERTVFLLEIQPEHFADALDIWAQFFISPLLKYDSIKREVKAVDAEFDMSLNMDSVRKEQLVGGYLFEKGHPMGKFMWGNKESLYDAPAKKGINVYSSLKSFHKKYYTANRMTLTVQSPEELDTLEEWVKTIFENIPSGTEELIAYPPANLEVTPYQVVQVVPVKNIQVIQLVWALPPQQKYYRTKPLHYMSWLVGHEGKGSILSLLKNGKLAFSLCGGNEGSGFEHNCTCSLFKISITLTDEGFVRYCEVLDIVFQYLAMLQKEGASERIFREIQKIEDIDFAFEEEEPPMDVVESLCENVLLYPEEEILTGDDLLFEFDEDCINNALHALRPDNCVILLSSPSFKKLQKPMKEPWFGTQYFLSSVPDDWQDKWRKGFENKIHDNLHLPFPNNFVADNFDLKCDSELNGSPVDDMKYPRLISASDCGYKLWFRQDDIFKLPKAYVRIHLLNPLSFQSPQNTVYLELLVQLLVHNLAEVAYDADAASLTYGVEVGGYGGLILRFFGFNDKLDALVDTVASFLADFNCNGQDYSQRLLQHQRGYFNTLIKPGKLAKMLRLSILKQFTWSTVDKYNSCQSLKYDEFLKFVQDFLSSLYVESLVQGNFTQNEAKAIVGNFFAKLKCNPSPGEKLTKQRIIKLVGPPKVCKVSGLNDTDENSMVAMYFQYGPYTVKDGALVRLLEAILEEPCFDILRTKQQLGYTVYVDRHVTGGIIGFSVNVATQTSKFSVEETMKRIVEFVMKTMANTIKKMPAEEFDTHLKSLIAVLRNDDTHLGEEVGRNWSEILSRKYHFDRAQKEIAILETCSLNDFKKFYVTMCSENDKILHLHVEGSCKEYGKSLLEKSDQNDVPPSSENSLGTNPMVLQFLKSEETGYHYITSMESLRNSSGYYQVSGNLQ